MTAILLIPGLNCSARIFTHQVPVLWQHGPVTIADHRRGETIETIAQSIVTAAPPSFALLGFSMGGYIALEVVRQAPERVEKLALLATNARTDTPAQAEKRRTRIATVEAGGFEADLQQQFPLSVHQSHAQDEVLFAAYLMMAKEAGSDTFVRHSKAIIGRRDQRELLPAIDCPTLVVAGAGDQLMPAEVTDELAAGIPGARLLTLPDCGHFFPIEQPERLNEALSEWISR